MEFDDFARGAVAALLVDQVEGKTGLAYRIAGAMSLVAGAGVVFLDGWLRAMAVIVLLIGLGLLGFVFLSKAAALRLITRVGRPADLSGAPAHFAAAVDEADLPSGPFGFLRLIWRLRKGVGPEIERLGEVVTRLKGQLDA